MTLLSALGLSCKIEHFDNMIEPEGFVFTGVERSYKDLYHTNDWIYKGDTKDVIDSYFTYGLDKCTEIAKELGSKIGC